MSRGAEATLPELERMLTTTAAKHVRRSAPGRRIGSWRASRVALAAGACLAFAGTAMAATGVWNPPIGNVASNSAPPTISQGPVPTDVTAALGALRREPDARDHGPEVEKTLSTLGSSFVEGIRPDSVRYLEPWGEHGEARILFSAEGSVFASASDPACVATPSTGGAGAVNGEAGVECFDLDKILAGKALMSWERLPDGPGEAFGLVPDGVASVSAELSNGYVVNAPVTSNFFTLDWDAGLAGKGFAPPRIIWRDDRGAIVPPR